MKLIAFLTLTFIAPHAFAEDTAILKKVGEMILSSAGCREAYANSYLKEWHDCLDNSGYWYEKEAHERMRQFALEKGRSEPDFTGEKITETVKDLISERQLEVEHLFRKENARLSKECQPFFYMDSYCSAAERKKSPTTCGTRTICMDRITGSQMLAEQAGDRYVEKLGKWNQDFLAGKFDEVKKVAAVKVESAETLNDLNGRIVKQDASLPFGNLDEKTNSARFQNGDCDFKVAGMKKGFKDFSKMYTAKDLEWKVGPFTKVSQSDDQYADAIRICQAKTDPDEQKTCIGVVQAQGTYLGSGYVLLQANDGKVLVVSSKGDEEGIRTCLTQNGLVPSETNQTAGKTDEGPAAAAAAAPAAR